MSDVTVKGDLRVTGNLSVNGSLPDVGRSGLTQDNEAPYGVPLQELRVHDAVHTVLPGTAATDDLALVGNTIGTDAPHVSSGDLKSAGATTRYARFSRPLPAEYQDGQTVKVNIAAGMLTTVADTSATVDVEAYQVDRETGVSADLCATAAQSCNSLTFADLAFVITPTALAAGDMLDVRIAVAVNDGATATAVEAAIAAVDLLLDIKG